MVFSSLSGVTPQCGAQGLRAVSEGTNCQGYDSVNDWCGARLFLSACQVAGMFNVLIIGCSVVYISLSAPLSHLNCQSTSKACRSFVFFPTSWMFSPQLSAGDLLWPESQLTDRSPIKKKTSTHFPFVVQGKHRCSCNGGDDCHGRLAPDSCVISLICRQGDTKYSFLPQCGF